MTSHKLYDVRSNITKEVAADFTKLAARLREFRLNRDLTYLQLSALIGISKSVLQRIETGTASRLHARTVRKLKRFLEASRAA